MSEQDISIKKGETCIQMSLRRSKGGLRLSVKTHPAMEELIRGWGNGTRVDARLIGREWKSDGLLEVWHLNDALLGIRGIPGTDAAYRLDRVGYAFDIPGDKSINLSFFRIVGVSAGEGATITIPGIFELDDIRATAARIRAATRKFYTDYMLPVDLTITMSTQEVKL